MKQNEKILYLSKILHERTNENHPMTAKQLMDRLSAWGAKAERKSIYAAVDTLISFGYDIQRSRSEPKGYYMASRDFELAEIKLLVDAVQASKVITGKKSIELIDKLKDLTDVHSARRLQRQVVIAGRAKMSNERVYYSIDAVYDAIAAGKKISFQYCEYDINKNLVPRKHGKTYVYTPALLIWDDERYYLVAYDGRHDNYLNFRADKMINVTVLDEDAAERRKPLDAAQYSKSVFSMFHGEFQDVVIAASNSLIGAFLDKFGMDATLRRQSDRSFAVKANVAVSGTFFAWLSQYGDMAQIVSPQSVVEKYKEHMKKILSVYE